jgi:hypothetical protein
MLVHCRGLILVVALHMAMSGAALAQQHSVPIGPQSGYDPFIWNYHTGRFDYVPIPYEPEPPGTNYSPYRFNWHSGRWDYVAQPLASDYDALPRENEASTFMDTRVDLQQLSPRTTPAPAADAAAPPMAMKLPPPPINPHLPRPATSPSTKPLSPQLASKREQELARLRSVGRWDYDYARGRWIFVLPGE